VLVEVRQFPGAIGARTAPAKSCDLHACQYQRAVRGGPGRLAAGAFAESKSYRKHVLAACGELGESGQGIAVVFCAWRGPGRRHRCLFLLQPIGHAED
jgi:hypothetical protein